MRQTELVVKKSILANHGDDVLTEADEETGDRSGLCP
jgi:hypothetical protein